MNGIRLDKDNYRTSVPFCQAGKEKNLKIDLKIPGGGELHFEKRPMSDDVRFELLIGLILAGVLVFFLAMF